MTFTPNQFVDPRPGQFDNELSFLKSSAKAPITLQVHFVQGADLLAVLPLP